MLSAKKDVVEARGPAMLEGNVYNLLSYLFVILYFDLFNYEFSCGNWYFFDGVFFLGVYHLKKITLNGVQNITVLQVLKIL
jgi:hypothetical protein